MQITLVTKEAFQIVGILWRGTYAQAAAGEIRHVMAEMKRRYMEIPQQAQPDSIFGISIEHHAEGFTYLIGAPVHDSLVLPDGMIRRFVPTQTYVTGQAGKGTNIEEAYREMFRWIEENGYKQKQDVLTHLEIYPLHGDPFDNEPELTMMIPVYP